MSPVTVRENTKTASPIKDITDTSILEEIALILCVIEDLEVV
jgi:hypothetical protein